ncbi:MAG: FmdB family zinc ribbon protein [bacterium]
MPIYSYHCEQCQTEFTELRRCSEMDAPGRLPGMRRS